MAGTTDNSTLFNAMVAKVIAKVAFWIPVSIDMLIACGLLNLKITAKPKPTVIVEIFKRMAGNPA